VEVAPNANPPVCRIMDFGKFKFDEAQRAKESRRKTTSSSIKEMKYRPKIGVGDFDTKTRQVTKFLGEGHKVKITIMFRGREMSHPELGKKLLDQVAVQVGTIAKIEAAPKLDGRNMIMVLAPDRRSGAQTASAAKAGTRPPAQSTATEAPPMATAAPAAIAPPAAATATPAPINPAPINPAPITQAAPQLAQAPPSEASPSEASPTEASPTEATTSAVPPTSSPVTAADGGATAAPQPNGRVPGTPAPTTGVPTTPNPAEET
jgi:translation initiation factor IF-3